MPIMRRCRPMRLSVSATRWWRRRPWGSRPQKPRNGRLGARCGGCWPKRGCRRVAAEGFQAPGVVVSYTGDPDVQNGAKFAAEGMQIAAGVPLQVGEGAEFKTFRLGLFGLDKLKDVDATVARLKRAVDAVL